MDLQNKLITVFGGTGFVGSYAIAEMARRGATIKVATRHPASAYSLRQFGAVGQIVPVYCDYTPASIDKAIQGSEMVVNCTGILFEKRKSTFKKVHTEDARLIATSCAVHNIKRLVHVSALGVETGKSNYAKSKIAGEELVRANFPAATILRPSTIFGPEDDFFNKFAQLSVFLPMLPLIGGGKTKFQPVYVGDVALAIVGALVSGNAGGKTYELGGPEVLDFKGIYGKIFAQTGRVRMMMYVPKILARVKALFLGLLPTPLLTNDMITSLQTDTIVSSQALTLADIGVQATALDAILPLYLDHYRVGGKFFDRKRA